VLAAEVAEHGLEETCEIVVSDDGSEPDRAQSARDSMTRTGSRSIEYLRSEVNTGVGPARNRGIAHSRGEVIAFLDDDLVPAPDYLRQTLAVHREHPEVPVIAGNLLPLRDDVYSRFWFYRYAAVFNREGELYPVPMLSGGHCSFKRDFIDREMGPELFDTELRTQEDYDLYLRLRGRGVEIRKSDRILAYNDCRRSLPAFVRQHVGYRKGGAELLRKHDPELIAVHDQARRIDWNWRFLHLHCVLWGVSRSLRAAARVRRLALRR
jgi:glycosyltransferase involved in cell wall biosynthesis